MFKSLIKKLFSKSTKHQPNYFYFEDERNANQDCQDENIAKTQYTTASEKLQLTSSEEIHQQAFYDFLFGCASTNEQQDELSGYVSKQIEQCILQPKLILESLPLLPVSLTTIIEQLNDNEFDTDVLISLIQKEPLIAVKVIELANSSYYNKSHKEITNLKSAFLLLGSNGLIEGIINGFIAKLTPQSPIYFKQYGNKIWQHCFTTGMIAKQLINNSPHKQESAQGYLIGLLCNMGDMIIYQLLIEAFNYVHPDCQPSSKAFKALLSKNSKRMTYHIAKYWNLPPSILDALALQAQLTHSTMLPAIHSKRPIACYVYEANIISELELRFEHQEISSETLDEVKSSMVFSDEAKRYLENLNSMAC
ncbi:hypothetical protein NBRC116592_31430 [Colwellia sp. KU-HH00111]|uniref:HDOD domain-containing protein n=1 Tax=Colwellia sp. KU-HH00111 TaxID=3127652 RepID=UPI003102BE63